MSIWTDHPNSTTNPQSYWEHMSFALPNSLKLIFAGVKGVIHAFLPFVFPFDASTAVIRLFLGIVKSKRHGPELTRELPEDWFFGLSRKEE